MTAVPPGAVVLVTGATGFLGSHCLSRLLAESCDVHATSRDRAGACPPAGDVACRGPSGSGSRSAISSDGFSRPICCTAPGSRPRGASGRTCRTWTGCNQGSPFCAASAKPEARASSASAPAPSTTGNSTRLAEDETPIRPGTLYGKAKAAMAAAVQAFSAHYRFSAAWGRVFLPYGPGDPPQRLVPTVD